MEWANRFEEVNNNPVEIVIRYKGISPLYEIVFLHNNQPVDIELDEKIRE